MFSIFKKKVPVSAQVNGAAVVVQPGETLLQAALNQGIDFPHSCRVGGCATCKCRLTQGRVKELTRTGYVLSDSELDQGYILACQSVPQTDVCIEVDMTNQHLRRCVSGKVVGQERLTHDITQIRIQLDEALQYKAGQFASLSLAILGNISRSYSFATPVQPDAQVQFFVRKVPGGALSTLVNEASVVGETVNVEGPLGEFWLRPGDTPLMFVAGGSGLAPILAVIKDAIQSGTRRPAVLLFGARQERDLYALKEIEALGKQWGSAFSFIPVLSDAAESGTWKGARGNVGDKIAEHLAPGAHAYLCGPPAMIDACQDILERRGVSREHIFADRFTTTWRQQ